MKNIDQICMRFLWSGSDEKTKSARVSWSKICLPKSEGGLGFKDLLSWNRACLIQQLWQILYEDGSLWIAWVKAYLIQDRDLMTMPVSISCSWHWKKLMGLRAEAANVFQAVGVMQSRKLSVIWEEIRPREAKVDWSRLVWCPLYIPRHSFISWLARLDRLPTKDRLSSWGMVVDSICPLRFVHDESRDHLFVDCEYASFLWKELLKLCDVVRPIGDWNTEVNWLISYCKGKSLRLILLRLAWNAMICWIWRERNARLFQQKKRSMVVLLQVIIDAVKFKDALVKVSDFVLVRNWNLA